MALVLKDRVKETTTTSGTGTYTLAGAETGFEAFSQIGNGNTTYYCCTDGVNFEIGIGTYTLSGTTLARTTILQSSNSDAAVDWVSGATRTIFCTQPAEKAVFLDASGNAVINGDLTVTGDDITMSTNTSGHILVADGTNYNPVAVSGDVTIASTGAVTIAAQAVENSMLADDAVGADELAASAVVTASIVDGNVTTAKIAADAVTGAKIADDAINSEHYTDGSIDTAHIADAQVTLAKIANQAANTVLVRDANSSGVVSAKALATTEILIGDGTGFTAASLSGDVTMTNAGVVTIANGAVENAMLADDAVGADELAANAVVNASVASGAAIADTKLATISTAGKVALTALEIDGADDIGADLTTSDLIIIDDGAGGTNRKAALSRVVTLMTAQGFSSDDPTALAIALG
jgi:hypothetical protein